MALWLMEPTLLSFPQATRTTKTRVLPCEYATPNLFARLITFGYAAFTLGQVSHFWHPLSLAASLISMKGGKSAENDATGRSVGISISCPPVLMWYSQYQNIAGPQRSNQTIENPYNKALLVWLIQDQPVLSFPHFSQRSVETKRPVRVVRGPNPSSPWAPVKGYRYDGLYIVDEVSILDSPSDYCMIPFLCRRRKTSEKMASSSSSSSSESVLRTRML